MRFLILCYLLSISSAEKLNCYHKEIAHDELRPCSSFTDKVLDQIDKFETAKPTSEDLKNVKGICENFKTCISNKQCKNVESIRGIFNICRHFEFHAAQITACLQTFFLEVYSPSSKPECARTLDFFAKDLVTAFTRGKDCFLSIAKHKCSLRAYQFIKESTNYSEFLKLLVPAGKSEKTCQELPSIISRTQCTPIIEKLVDMKTTTDYLAKNRTAQQEALAVCQDGLKCLKNSCSHIDAPEVNDYGFSTHKTQCLMIENVNSKLWKCAENVESDKCENEVEELKKTGITDKCLVMELQRKCLRQQLKKTCKTDRDSDYDDYIFAMNQEFDCPFFPK